jgi:hypothetical protein
MGFQISVTVLGDLRHFLFTTFMTMCSPTERCCPVQVHWCRPDCTTYPGRQCFSICLSIYGSTALLLDLGCFLSFLIFYTVSRTPWTGDQPITRPLPAHRTAHTQNKPRIGFEPTITAFERAKTVHALDRVATVIGSAFHIWFSYNWLVTWQTTLNNCRLRHVRTCK